MTADFHVHTTYCDGADSPRKMVLAAIDRGLSAIGFSAHSYTYFDETYCIKQAEIPNYKEEIAALRAEFADTIRILCGVEQDVYSAESTAGYDYSIGSVHYVQKDGVFYPVDHSAGCFEAACREAFGGDYYAFAESYFAAAATVADRVKPDIIGHFDLISKFNRGGRYFDETHPRYVKAWKAALDALLPAGIPFEVNTGAITRGYRDVPYPSREQLLYIRDHGGRVLLSGDAHSTAGLCFLFAEWEGLLREMKIPVLDASDFCRKG